MSEKNNKCLVLKKANDGRWLSYSNGWVDDLVYEPGDGTTRFLARGLEAGDYQVIRMEWYDTHGSGQPRSHFFRVTRIPARMEATELSLAQAEYGAN